MNRSYNKIRHIRDANSLLESRTILSEQDDKPILNPNSTYMGNALINKVATEGIKNVTPQMISSPQFKGSYSGYQFGGVFNEVDYQWDCNGVEGMSGIRGMVDGEILTETVENMLAAIKKPVTDAKPGSFCVGFYAPASKFIIYTNTSNKPMCINF
jgi:hypothetical protein